MHYLFVYFLSELSMYSDTGVGWNFHRGVEILKTPDNVGRLVAVHLGVKSEKLKLRCPEPGVEVKVYLRCRTETNARKESY